MMRICEQLYWQIVSAAALNEAVASLEDRALSNLIRYIRRELVGTEDKAGVPYLVLSLCEEEAIERFIQSSHD